MPHVVTRYLLKRFDTSIAVFEVFPFACRWVTGPKSEIDPSYIRDTSHGGGAASLLDSEAFDVVRDGQ